MCEEHHMMFSCSLFPVLNVLAAESVQANRDNNPTIQ